MTENRRGRSVAMFWVEAWAFDPMTPAPEMREIASLLIEHEVKYRLWRNGQYAFKVGDWVKWHSNHEMSEIPFGMVTAINPSDEPFFYGESSSSGFGHRMQYRVSWVTGDNAVEHMWCEGLELISVAPPVAPTN